MNSYDKHYDIIVVGLGTAGAIALIAAAKRGYKVLGIESLNAQGGTGTLGGISGYYFGARGGLYEEINSEEHDLQAGMYCESDNPRYDAKAFVLEQTALQYGAEIMYDTRVTEVFCTRKNVEGVVCFYNGSFLSIGAKIVIDCTGEGYIARMAGCSWRAGRRCDGQTQPFSNMAIAVKGNYVYGVNKDTGYVKQWDCKEQSKKIIESTAQLIHIFKNAGKESAFLTTASLLGVRQGPAITGEQGVTLEGYLNGERADNPIFYAYSNVDNHGKDTAFEDDILLDWYVGAGLWEICFSVPVPMGAIIPKGYTGILTAGRCLDVDHNIAPCIRMKSDMEKCGEAAAELACLAIEGGNKPIDVDYSVLAQRLSETGCLSTENHVGLHKKNKEGQMESFAWLADADEIVNELSGDRPGIAIWSAKLLGDSIKKRLADCLSSDDPRTQKNAAIALGLLGDISACGVLREMAKSRDNYIPKTSFKYSYTHGITAVYLLGRLADRGSTEILLDIIRSHGAFDEERFTKDELFTTVDDVRFQYMSYALSALKKISQAHPDLADNIKEVVDKSLSELDIYITLKMNPYVRHNMGDKLRVF